jgi:hypothetical protein
MKEWEGKGKSKKVAKIKRKAFLVFFFGGKRNNKTKWISQVELEANKREK